MKKFAYLNYADSEEQFIQNKLILRLPQRLKDWYVLKSNPFLIADIALFNAYGYKIVLPLVKNNNAKADNIINRTLEDLIGLDVDIASLPIGAKCDQQSIIITDIKRILPFFIIDASAKALKKENKIIKNAEFLIIDDGRIKTETIIYIIYKHINFLSIFTNRPDYFSQISSDIYGDCGLNLQIITNKAAISTADVIISVSESNEYDYFFKRNSVCFAFYRNSELLCKRQDMIVINGLEFRYGEGYIDLDKFEMAIYILSENYRRYISGRYTLYDLEKINNYIKGLKIAITSFLN